MQKRFESEKSRNTPPPNMSVFLFIRLAAAAYILYLTYQIIDLYIKGGEEAPTLTFLIFSTLFLGGSAIAIAWISVKQYRRMKDEAAQSVPEEENPDVLPQPEEPDETQINAISESESCKNDDETEEN